MKSQLVLTVLALGFSPALLAYNNWSQGFSNSYSNSVQNDTFLLGIGEVVNNNSATADAWLFMEGLNTTATNVSGSFICGFTDTIQNSSSIYLYGSDSSVNTSAGSGLFGKQNTILASNDAWILGYGNQVNNSPWTNSVVGTSNTIANSSSTFTLGATNGVTWGTRNVAIGHSANLNGAQDAYVMGNTNAVTSGQFVAVVGSNNTVSTSYNTAVTNRQNTVTGSNAVNVMGWQNLAANMSYSTAIGFCNSMQASSAGAQNVYLMGSNLNANPTTAFNGLVMLGVNNAPLTLTGDLTASTSPLLVVGNGVSTATRSNAMVMQKSGRTTFTNLAYVTPTVGNPAPSQPETLVVEGSATVKGTLVLTQRQGDIWMGGFGRTEDSGPSN